MTDVTNRPDPSPPEDAFNELIELRSKLRKAITKTLGNLDPSAPETLQYATKAMLEAHFEPKELSALLGPSRTTIGRWAVGQTIPRSPPYRKWCVETLLKHLVATEEGQPHPKSPKLDSDDDKPEQGGGASGRPKPRRTASSRSHMTAGWRALYATISHLKKLV